MKKIIKLLLIFLMTITSSTVGYSEWLIALNNGEGSTIIPKVGEPVCYNKTTGTKYLSLSKALETATTNQNIYVYPGNVINITQDLTIPEQVNLYLPYEGETCNITKEDQMIADGGLGDASQNDVNTNRVSLLNLRNGADLTINGSLTIGSIFTAKGVRNKYCEVNLGDNSSIICNGTLNCFGYIKEDPKTAKNTSQTNYKNYRNNEFDSNRKVIINNGANLKTTMSIFDMKSGGDFDTLNSNGICPFNYINFTNVQSFVEFKHGANFNAEAHIEIAKQKAIVNVNIVRPSSSKDPSLYYTNGGSLNLEYCPKNVKFTGQRDDLNVFINGDVKQGYLEIKSIQTIKTSNYFLPMSECFNIFILKDSVFNCDYRIKFLPSSSLIVEKGGTFNLNSELVVYKSDSADLPTLKNDSTCGHLMNKTDALFINNGILNVNANAKIGAEILTEVEDDKAKITFDPTSSTEVISKEGKSNVDIKIISSGLFKNNGNIVSSQFVKGTIVTSDIDGGKCWIGEAVSVVVFNINVDKTAIKNAITNYRVFIADDANGTNTKELTTQSMQDSSSYQIETNKYFKVNLVDYVSATLVPTGQEELPFESNKWYLASSNYDLNIIPNEAVHLKFSSTSISGNSQTKFIVSVSDTKDGTYTELPTQLGSGNFDIPKNKWFKFKMTPGGLLSLKGSSVKAGPPEYVGKECAQNTPYPASQDYHFDFTLAQSCLIAGEQVLMSDGTYNNVEDIDINDKIISFNHNTGEFEESNILCIFNHGEGLWQTTTLYFENGYKVTIAGNHDLFNKTKNTYVTINGSNVYDYLNDSFVCIDGNNNIITSKLIRIETKEIKTKAYTIVSDKNLNCVANGILNSVGFLNSYFDFDDDLTYNEEAKQMDIEKYGLFTYEEVKDLINYSMFEGGNFKYFKVMLGKNQISEEFFSNNLIYFKEWIESSELIVNNNLYKNE